MEKKNKRLTKQEIDERKQQILLAIEKCEKENGFSINFGCGCCGGGIYFQDKNGNEYEV